MGDYNYLEAYVLLVDSAPETAFQAGAVDDADCKYLGVIKSDSGFKLTKDQVQNASTGKEVVLTWKIEVNAPILTKLTQTQKESLDGITGSLVFLPIDGVVVPDDWTPLTGTLNDAGVTLPDPANALMTRPMTLYVEEDEKYGTGAVSPIVLSGEKKAATKAELRKEITITDTV